jgi:ribosomal protein S20
MNNQYLNGINKNAIKETLKDYLISNNIDKNRVQQFINNYPDIIDKLVEKVIIESGF